MGICVCVHKVRYTSFYVGTYFNVYVKVRNMHIFAPALKTAVSNCTEYKKPFISAFNGNIITFQKHGISILKWPLFRRPLLT